jgi:hypothetical protein
LPISDCGLAIADFGLRIDAYLQRVGSDSLSVLRGATGGRAFFLPSNLWKISARIFPRPGKLPKDFSPMAQERAMVGERKTTLLHGWGGLLRTGWF